ncbi:hypothetical protein MJO28_009193 [Puccinia striiformis f. sp. tritici]|uniref:Uncharacterized protein n=1 Tax=Puccinia striiformis f. sp. tritici TaxID=168172 RepID=A0ACC0E8I3_9BASI|nr:hypothetical protein MJO28_009193 [Puccinia striiformis f. sp. tritici]
MILSSYLFLLLFVAHSPHSLARYTLHKRMELGTTLKGVAHLGESASDLTGASSSAVHSANSLVHADAPTLSEAAEAAPNIYKSTPRPESNGLSPSDAKNSLHSDSTGRPQGNDLELSGAPHPQNSDLGPHLPPPIEAPKLTSAGHFKHRLLLRWKSLSLSFQRISNLFSRSAPRSFSYVTKLEKEFSQMPADEIRRMADYAITELTNDRATMHVFLRKGPTPISGVADVKEKATQYLSDIHTYLHQVLPQHKEILADRGAKIAEALKPALGSSSNAKEPLASLGTQLARINEKDLVDSRLGIRFYGGKDVAPVADLHGFLGPDNVFSSQLALLLKNEGIVGKLPNDFKPDEFVKELEELQTHLSVLATYSSSARQAAKSRQALPPFPTEQVTEIRKFQDTQAAIFGEPAAFQSMMSRLEKSEPYQAFQQDLKFPQDTAGFELQFIKPLGITNDHDLDVITVEDAHQLKLRLDRPVESVTALSGTARSLARENTVERLDISSQARELRERLLTIFTEKGVDMLSKTMRPTPSKAPRLPNSLADTSHLSNSLADTSHLPNSLAGPPRPLQPVPAPVPQ